MSSPSTLSRPAESLSRWLMQRRNVDLPDPDGPTRHMTSPRFTVREMLLSTWFVPKLFDTRSACTIGTSEEAPALEDFGPVIAVIAHLRVWGCSMGCPRGAQATRWVHRERRSATVRPGCRRGPLSCGPAAGRRRHARTVFP